MAYAPPNVYYASVFDGTYTKLNGVQSVSINRGKARFQDPTTASQCSIEVIPQPTFPAMTIGQFIDIRDTNSGASSAYFAGKITDIQRTYAIPYNAGTGATPADRVVITVTGGTGVLASGYGSEGYGAGTVVDASEQMMTGTMLVTNVYAVTSQNIGYSYPTFSTIVPIGQNVLIPNVAPWFDNINRVMNTVQYSIDDLDLNRTFKPNYGNQFTIYAGVYFYPTGQTGKSISFVDDGSTGSTVYKYGQIDYVSSVQSAFSQVLIQYAKYAASLYTNEELNVVLGDPPYVGFSYPTTIATTTQGTNLGNYILAVNSSASPVPFSIGTTTAIQESAAALGKLSECPIGTAVTVKFRGTTVNATVSGISVNYYAEQANIRLSLTPSLGTSFTLDSSAFGVLNTNRLGYP